jgi:predicted RecA/RadA family phage recombinase
MAQNGVNGGSVIHAAATHPAAPNSGDAVIVGTIPGVCIVKEGEGGNAAGVASIQTEGVFDLPVTGKDADLAAAAVAKGDYLYYSYSPTAAELTEAVKQIDTITLTGASGTANVTLAGGLTKLATFGDDLTDTAADFVTSHAAAYDAVNIVVTSDGADLVFTAKTAGTGFAHPAIANVSGNLAGTVVNTRSNGVLFGKALGVVAEGDTPETETIPVMLIQA